MEQTFVLAAYIWTLTEILRKVKLFKDVTQAVDGETLALLVAIVTVSAAIAVGYLPATFASFVKGLAALLGSQLFHDKVASKAKL